MSFLYEPYRAKYTIMNFAIAINLFYCIVTAICDFFYTDFRSVAEIEKNTLFPMEKSVLCFGGAIRI